MVKVGEQKEYKMLTRLEARVLAVIEQFIKEHEFAPTIAEIAQELGISSRGTVHRYVQSLIGKGNLVREGKGWRGLRVAGSQPQNPLGKSAGTEENNRSRTEMNTSNVMADPGLDLAMDQLKIPLLGKIAAGVPIEAIPDEQHLDLAVFLIGPDRYALRVTGESMIDAGILDGDTVILRKSSTARRGDIVVALIDNQEATLKRLGKTENGMIELIPENAEMPLMLYSEKRVAIQGVLIGQLRSY